ncbi:MAG: CDP-alcohol phosphatidyltransferase family protein [Candidatus Falkowbacteria bacterium]
MNIKFIKRITHVIREAINKDEIWTMPNTFTTTRLLLIPFICYFICGGQRILALVLFILGAITDFFDGEVARRFNQVTRIGENYDQFADKIFVISILTCLAYCAGLWLWVATVIIFREILVLIGRTLVINTPQEKAITVEMHGKIKATFQYIIISYTILGLPYFNWTMSVVAFITILSAVKYWKKFKLMLSEELAEKGE